VDDAVKDSDIQRLLTHLAFVKVAGFELAVIADGRFVSLPKSGVPLPQAVAAKLQIYEMDRS